MILHIFSQLTKAAYKVDKNEKPYKLQPVWKGRLMRPWTIHYPFYTLLYVDHIYIDQIFVPALLTLTAYISAPHLQNIFIFS